MAPFPHGLSAFGVPVFGGGELIPVTTGKYIWVDSNNSMGGTGIGTFANPYRTLAAAYAACTASKDDVIIMKSGHAETIATNTALTFSKIGVSVIGLGRGNRRPAITLTGTTTAATIAVSAANQLFRNFTITSGRDEMVSIWTITADYCTIDGVDYLDNAAASIASYVTTTTNGNFLTVKNCSIVNSVTATLAGACLMIVASDDTQILNNYIWWTNTNAATSCAIGCLGTASLRTRIIGNTIMVGGGNAVVGINTMAASTGLVAYNNTATTKTAVAACTVLTATYGIQNFATETVNTQGILDPVAT